MVHTEIWVPGNIVTPNAHTLPTGAPGIALITGLQLLRTGSGFAVSAHAGADVSVHTGTDVSAHANAAVDAHANAAVNAHVPTLNVGTVAADIMHLDDASAFSVPEAAGARELPHVVVQADAHVFTQADAHTITQPIAHTITQPSNHTITGADPVVAAVATRLSRTTFSLDVDTLAGDTLVLRYIQEGYLIQVA